MDTSFTGKRLNDIMSGLGIVAGAPASLDVRVTSSYSNNNEAYMSNVLTIKAFLTSINNRRNFTSRPAHFIHQ